MELFKVVITATIVVVGEDTADALRRTRGDMEMIKDSEFMEIESAEPLRGQLLPPGWDGTCAPYGDEDCKTIKEYLKEWSTQEATNEH